MDFWASLDHQLKYKKEMTEEEAAEIGEDLRRCAEVIAGTDWKMLEIRRKIEDREQMKEYDINKGREKVV